MQTLRQMHYGPVLGRPPNGTEEGIKRITQSDVREFFESHYHAGESIMRNRGQCDATLAYQWVEDCSVSGIPNP